MRAGGALGQSGGVALRGRGGGPRMGAANARSSAPALQARAADACSKRALHCWGCLIQVPWDVGMWNAPTNCAGKGSLGVGAHVRASLRGGEQRGKSSHRGELGGEVW